MTLLALLKAEGSTLGASPRKYTVARLGQEANAWVPMLVSYAIGALLYDSLGAWLIHLYGYGDKVEAFREAYAQWGAYGASKAALRHMSAIWDEELAAERVRFALQIPVHFGRPVLAGADAQSLALLGRGELRVRAELVAHPRRLAAQGLVVEALDVQSEFLDVLRFPHLNVPTCAGRVAPTPWGAFPSEGQATDS